MSGFTADSGPSNHKALIATSVALKSLVANKLMMVNQRVGERKRSFVNKLLSFLNEIKGRIDRAEGVEVRLPGFQKAFDFMNYKLLDRKVKARYRC